MDSDSGILLRVHFLRLHFRLKHDDRSKQSRPPLEADGDETDPQDSVEENEDKEDPQIQTMAVFSEATTVSSSTDTRTYEMRI